VSVKQNIQNKSLHNRGDCANAVMNYRTIALLCDTPEIIQDTYQSKQTIGKKQGKQLLIVPNANLEIGLN